MVKKLAVRSTTKKNPDNLISLEGGYQVQFFYDFRQIPSVWDRLAPSNNLFLQRSYLSVLQSFAPDEMKFCYSLFYEDNKAVGLALFQIQHFKADSSIANTTSNQIPCFFSAVSKVLRKLLSKHVAFNTLVCGNLLLTGAHGFYFDESQIGKKVAFELVGEAMENAKLEIEKKGTPISVYLIKDFDETERNPAQNLSPQGFNEFTIQPNMVFPIRKEWKHFDDYLNAFQSKYRVRARRAFKKATAILKKELHEKDIAHHLDSIYELYGQVVENANFNVIKLHKNYFLGLKQTLGDRFRMFGYFVNEELIGFYTTINNSDELEAHFLGIKQIVNKKHQVYLNMLYDMVREGIDGQYQRIIFARTALEIKSSVGAVPLEMYCYMRHQNSFSNKFAGNLFEYLRPKHEWVQRKPFK